MGNKIIVNMGEMAVGQADEVETIETGGIGSCVVIVLYDDETKIGGLAHAMLPTNKSEAVKKDVVETARASIQTDTTVAKYVDRSIDNLIIEIGKIGGKKENLKAKIIGGARMFRLLSGDKFGIGFQNSEMAKKHLAELGIPLESEDVGGTVGRNAKLQLSNGLVSVSTMM
ncbi:MAG: chemotaxis protein CheD [Candidatus Uhrbacteria bacterium]